jgi:outer membrane receptor for ferrienterochelin and colicin
MFESTVRWPFAVVFLTAGASVLPWPAAGAGLEEIVVTGQRNMLPGSLAKQRDSDTIESVLTRDAIGQFPDQNFAEAARRLSGINVINDQGEGRFIAVRGLDSIFDIMTYAFGWSLADVAYPPVNLR